MGSEPERGPRKLGHVQVEEVQGALELVHGTADRLGTEADLGERRVHQVLEGACSLPRAISGSPMWPQILPLMMELPEPPWLFRSWGL